MNALRIVVTADPYIPVPPILYGGIERVVSFVVEGLIGRGHDVTLIAHPGSQTNARLVPYGSPPHVSRRARAAELMQVGAALWRRRTQTDVILSWGRLAALAPVLPIQRIPKVQRYCRQEVPWRGVGRAVRLGGESVMFAGSSDSVYADHVMDARSGRWVTVYDGIDTSLYTPVRATAPDAPLVFLGKLQHQKGAHNAIEIARLAGRRLLIAGPVDESERAYFNSEIGPHIDGDRVQYLGPANDIAKNALLGSAAVVLFTSGGKEGFGLVMAEAFACGTPVIAFRGGSIPEVVKPGINGFIANDVPHAATLIPAAMQLDRATIREDCVARFDAARAVDAFEAVLLSAVQRAAVQRASRRWLVRP